jgi:hypothetical protein
MQKYAYWCAVCIHAATSLSLVTHFLSSSEKDVLPSLTVYIPCSHETKFDLWGFIFIMLSAIIAGFRWSMSHILLQDCYCI